MPITMPSGMLMLSVSSPVATSRSSSCVDVPSGGMARRLTDASCTSEKVYSYALSAVVRTRSGIDVSFNTPVTVMVCGEKETVMLKEQDAVLPDVSRATYVTRTGLSFGDTATMARDAAEAMIKDEICIEVNGE